MAGNMTIKVGSVQGDSVLDGHKDEIDVLAWSWGMSQSGSMHLSRGGGAGKVNVNDLSFTKYIDKSSPALMQHCCKGDHFPEAVLTVRKAGGSPIEYLKVHMKEVIVSGVSTGGSGGEDRLTENITLNFAKVKMSYTGQKPDGAKDKTVDMAWNIPENTDKF